jgi:hypothetical protein
LINAQAAKLNGKQPQLQPGHSKNSNQDPNKRSSVPNVNSPINSNNNNNNNHSSHLNNPQNSGLQQQHYHPQQQQQHHHHSTSVAVVPPNSTATIQSGATSGNSQTNTLLNTILPILNLLVNRYRNSGHFNQGLSQSNNTNNVNLEAVVDDLKNSFIYLEQHNPGACDLFLKNIFFKIKEFEKCTLNNNN